MYSTANPLRVQMYPDFSNCSLRPVIYSTQQGKLSENVFCPPLLHFSLFSLFTWLSGSLRVIRTGAKIHRTTDTSSHKFFYKVVNVQVMSRVNSFKQPGFEAMGDNSGTSQCIVRTVCGPQGADNCGLISLRVQGGKQVEWRRTDDASTANTINAVPFTQIYKSYLLTANSLQCKHIRPLTTVG
jgi:hypothetical protein